MGTAIRPDPQDPDDLERLPPLDGDGTEGPEAPIAADDDLDPEAREEDDPRGDALDDSTPATAGQGVDLDDLTEANAADRGWLDEPSDDQALDLGGYDLVQGSLDAREERAIADRATVWEEPDEAAPPDDDFAASERVEGVDPLAEDGPVDADEDLRDEDLPALDADEQEGGADDAALLDERLARGETHEPVGVPWSGAPWSRVGAPLGLRGVTALACLPRGLLVASSATGVDASLLQVDLEGTRRGPPLGAIGARPVKALAARGPLVAAVAEAQEGREKSDLFLSRNTAGRFDPLVRGVDVVGVVVGTHRVWAVTGDGALVSVATAEGGVVAAAGTTPAPALEHHEIPGPAKAIATNAEGVVVALVVAGDGRPAALVHGVGDGGTRWDAIAIPATPADASPSGARREAASYGVAARAGFVAVTSGSEIHRRNAAGVWQRHLVQGVTTASAFTDDAGTLLVAVYAPAEDATALVCVDIAGHASVVALVGALADDPDSDGRILALACDDAHGVVWVGGAFGVAAFSTPSKA
jgi:hypothetical protein